VSWVPAKSMPALSSRITLTTTKPPTTPPSSAPRTAVPKRDQLSRDGQRIGTTQLLAASHRDQRVTGGDGIYDVRHLDFTQTTAFNGCGNDVTCTFNNHVQIGGGDVKQETVDYTCTPVQAVT